MALIYKEMLQIIRDPSALLIALALPLLLLFIFGSGVNLDSNTVRLGMVVEDKSPAAISLAASFQHSRFFDVTVATDTRMLKPLLVSGAIRGFVVIPHNFSVPDDVMYRSLQVVADGSEPNIASFVQNYTQGAVRTWASHQYSDTGGAVGTEMLSIDTRFWYNPELLSKNFLLPGSIGIVMTLIGTLLTSLVIAREWERGTMEALMATPVTSIQIVLGKLIPYFLLALLSMLVCFCVATLWYEVPFRGSFLALVAATSVFLFAALGQGLLISTLSRNQFLAAQFALVSAFLPAFMLSGFIFEISAMPLPIRTLTYGFAARYFVSCLHSLFLVGDLWRVLLPAMACMLGIACAFFVIIAAKTSKRLPS